MSVNRICAGVLSGCATSVATTVPALGSVGGILVGFSVLCLLLALQAWAERP